MQYVSGSLQTASNPLRTYPRVRQTKSSWHTTSGCLEVQCTGPKPQEAPLLIVTAYIFYGWSGETWEPSSLLLYAMRHILCATYIRAHWSLLFVHAVLSLLHACEFETPPTRSKGTKNLKRTVQYLNHHVIFPSIPHCLTVPHSGESMQPVALYIGNNHNWMGTYLTTVPTVPGSPGEGRRMSRHRTYRVDTSSTGWEYIK